jgi:hypothetical protein
MCNTEKYELIDNFLSNQLSKAEKSTFDKLVIDDSDFSNEVEKVRITDKVIHQLGLLETSNKLNQIHIKKNNAKSNYRLLAIGAVVLCIGLFGLYNLNSNEKKATAPNQNSFEVATKKTVTNKDKITSEIQYKEANSKNIQEETSPVVYAESKKIDTINTQATKSIVDTSFPNEVALTIVNDTSGLVPPITSEETKNDTITKEHTRNEVICADIFLTEYSTEPSCIGEGNGELVYSDEAFLGGLSPYKTFIYRLDDEENYLENNQLASGEYSMKVVDANGCPATISNIRISEKRCLQRIDETFAPVYGESWEYPKAAGVYEYTVIIKDMADLTILEKQVSLNEETDWNGQLENGTTIQKGVYFVAIKNEDEVFFIGSMTIIE